MKKILVINGPNLNLLGIREPDLYGSQTYAQLVAFIEAAGQALGLDVTVFQSNSEGALVSRIQEAYATYDGIVINAAAYTHTSVAILDALKAVGLPTVEVHLTDIHTRESFRQHSFISLYASETFCGFGFEGYRKALAYLAKEK